MSKEFWAPSTAHDEREFAQNLKGVIAFASTLGLLLASAAVRGLRSDEPAFACSRYTPVAEHQILKSFEASRLTTWLLLALQG